MSKIDVINLKKEKVGSIELSEEVFNGKVNQPLVLQAIKAYLAGLRQGTSMVKTKGLVRGGGKKPFKQKGTGNARQGSSRSPLQPGGGSTFGPQPRSYHQNTPKEMLRGAMRSVLADKFKSERLLVVDQFKLKDSKTKNLNSILEKDLGVGSVMLVDFKNDNLRLASRNLKKVGYQTADGLNVYEMVRHEWLVVSENAVKKLTERLSN